MTNKLKETEQLTKLKGKFQAKYGLIIDDYTAMMLEELELISGTIIGRNDEFSRLIDEAATKIISAKRHISFQNKWAAFYFAMGVIIPIILTGIVLTLAIFLYMKIKH